MNEGSPLRAVVWSLAVAVTLLAWPWLLAWLQRARPAWLAGTGVCDLSDLRTGLARPGPVRPGTLAAWVALVAAAGVLPSARGLVAADLDAGLLWFVVLALLALPWRGERTLVATTGGLVTLVLCILPAVMRTASLNLADLAIAQQGGAGNWFLLRDPFLLLAALLYLLTAASLWPEPPGRPSGGAEQVLDAALRAGLPLVLAHLFVVVFLGGWWAFVVMLDDAALVNSILKVLATIVALVALRRCPIRIEARHRCWLLPLSGLVCAVGAAVWMLATGAAW